MNRPSFDQYFLKIVLSIAERSTCLRHKVGAIIVKDKVLVSSGYNGAPKGMKHCLDIGCIRNDLQIPSGEQMEICRAVHAEQNAIIQACKAGIDTKGATLYCTHQPCLTCAKMIINAGIKRVVYINDYADKVGVGFLKEAKVDVEQIQYVEQTSAPKIHKKVCSEPGCDKVHHAKGFCIKHYKKYRNK